MARTYQIMKNLCLLLGASLLLTGCAKESGFEPACNGSCTVITGRFSTDDGRTGLAGVPLELKWVNFTGISHADIHRKTATSTDAKGNYTLRFHISDEELADGVFEITYRVDSKQYIVDRDNLGYADSRLKRDTIIVSNWLLPRKAYLHFDVTNPAQVTSYFSADCSFRHGGLGNGGQFNYDIATTIYSAGYPALAAADVEIAPNQPVEVMTTRLRNGQYVRERDTIQLAPGARAVRQITY